MTSTTTPGRASLTDRYIYAVQRSLPESQRADIDRELRGSIADAVEAKREAGVRDTVAEREVLLELGDPFRLAAGYADRPLHLIGPEYFPSYVRLLRLLYLIVLPAVAFAVTLGKIIAGPESVGEVIGSVVVTLLGLIVHLGFWTTLVFVILERSGTKADDFREEWTPDALPELPQKGDPKLGDAIGTVVFLVTMLGLLLWQQFAPPVAAADGTPLPVVNPDLWSSWLPVLFGIALLEIGFAILVYRVGRWTVPLAIVNAILAIAAGALVVWLFLTDRVWDPRALAELGVAGDTVWTVAVVSAWIAVGVAVWDIVDGAIKTWRHRRVAA